MIYIDSTFFIEIVKTQGIVGGLLIFFIWQNQTILKRLENAIKIMILCKDCKYKELFSDVESNEPKI